MKTLRPIMFVGTGSDVGKSVINTAFCRILLQDGYSPAPFKAQNMSLNSYATPDGLEIGRAQAVQAEACKLPCSVEMNPVLLKPSGDMTSQVVLNGKPAGSKSASEYFNDTNRDELFAEVMKSYNTLSNKHNPIVIEGAGSVSEMNLWDKDITNMRVAEATQATTFLVADIDRGGVFASLYGSVQLMPPNWRKLIKGIIINKFRGDMKLFEDAKNIIKDITGVPVVGIIPWFKNIHIEQEDSVVLDKVNKTPAKNKINIAVVHLRYLSNFTDFDALQQIPEVNLYFSSKPETIEQADIVILPGSKNVIADMQFLNHQNITEKIKQIHKAGTPIYGICGGYQLMGEKIFDPHAVEGNIPEIDALNILPVTTTLTKEKRTVQCQFKFFSHDAIIGEGYEIHMGQTYAKNPSPLCTLNDNLTDGYFLNSNTWGTYIHGIFDNDAVIKSVLQSINPQIEINTNYKANKEIEYDKLAKLVRDNTDMKLFYDLIKQQ